MTVGRLLAFALLSLASCGSLPQDVEGTLKRVERTREFRVGLIEGAAFHPGLPPGLLKRVSEATRARPVVERGAAEPLLAKLKAGELDLVVGPMTSDSPWQKQVHFVPHLAEKAGATGHLHLVAIARNGENAWIALLYREARQVGTVR